VDSFGGLGAASAYFDWLAWTLLVGVIVFGAIGSVGSRLSAPARVLGFLCGFGGTVATFYALLQYFDAQADAGADRHSPLYNSSWGLYCAGIGFLVAGLGAARGPGPDRAV
jgi:4-hydroxybenzoate polyprenyltransferase